MPYMDKVSLTWSGRKNTEESVWRVETKGAPNSVCTMATGHVMQHGPGICQDMHFILIK